MQDFSVSDPLRTDYTDLRSDTVTRPTRAMYARMCDAPIGDDGLDGDPSVRALEDAVAARLGKQAGLFAPTCTMANLLAVLAQTQRNQQVVLEASAHMYLTERGGAVLAGLGYYPVPGQAGAMDLAQLAAAVRAGPYKPSTGLIALETSHNNAGGAVLPLAHMEAVHTLAANAGIPVHIDGARLMNAAVALGVPAEQIARHGDSVSLCLSKGLSAPLGAVLAGSAAMIAAARTFRKMLGGTQRQAGIVAAAGLEGLQAMSDRLGEDHLRARRLSERLNTLGAGIISASVPQTNIVQVQVSASARSSQQWVAALGAQGVLTRPWGDTMLRCVTHRHIDEADLERADAAFRAVLRQWH
jgi:threonine aldolase